MNLPIVAIVGRPNVGKSTLFNRLVGFRKAIVDDKEGVTRDRHYATSDWAGHEFTLIDTGGYLPEARHIIDKAVAEQVDMAIEEADVIIFVVDAQSGVTEFDNALAKKLQKRSDDVVVAVNKVDDSRWEGEIWQFYNMGLGDPNPLSAMQGRSVGDFLDVVVSHFKNKIEENKDDIYFSLAVIGKENVGKSSFVNALMGKTQNIVTDIPGTTRDSVDSFLTYFGKKIRIVDTAGLKKRSKIKENLLFFSTLRSISAMEKSDVVAFFFDVNQQLSHYDVRLISEIADKQKGILLVANKWDLSEKDDKTQYKLEKEFQEKLGQYGYLPFIFASMTDRQRVGKVLKKLVEIFKERNKRVPTSELNEYFLPLIARTPPPAKMGREIKIKYITQIRDNPPVFAFFANHPKLVAENYKRFLEKKIREKFGFKGVTFRMVFKEK